VDLEEKKIPVYMQNFLIKKQIQSQDISYIHITPPQGCIGVQRRVHHIGHEGNSAIGPFCFPVSAIQTSVAISGFIIVPEILCRG